MSSVTHEVCTLRILDKVSESGALSQRSLAADLGIALGLTNSLVRRLVASGWIRVVRTAHGQARYELTRAGIAEKARLSRDRFLGTVRSYAEARDRIEQRLTDFLRRANGAVPNAVVFYGAGEIAEVGWLCAQRASLRLVGVVDDDHAGNNFLGFTVLPSASLGPEHCDGQPYDCVIVTAPGRSPRLRSRLQTIGVAAEKIFWLE